MFLVPVAIGLPACISSSVVWTGHRNFSGSRWEPGEMVVFTPDTVSLIKDSTVTADRGVLALRYTEGTNMEVLPLVMEVESPEEGIYRCDTLMVRLLPFSYRTADKGKMGIFETADTLSLPSRVLPGWTVAFYPAVEDDIEGIISLTFDILKTDQKANK